MRFIQKAFEISKTMNFQSMAYDSLYDERGNVALCEISYTYVDSAVYNCPGYWDSSLNWHEGHFWPQYCQLMDALKLPDLKQPDIEWFATKNLPMTMPYDKWLWLAGFRRIADCLEESQGRKIGKQGHK